MLNFVKIGWMGLETRSIASLRRKNSNSYLNILFSSSTIADLRGYLSFSYIPFSYHKKRVIPFYKRHIFPLKKSYIHAVEAAWPQYICIVKQQPLTINNMKTTKILYWVFTILFAFLMFGSAIPDALSMPVAIKGMHEGLGYPVYFVPFIGVAKILGVIAILIPGFPRLKEWAYAGLTFDLIGATYSIYCMPQNTPGGQWYFMLLPLSVAACAYIFYRKKIKGSAADAIGSK